MEFTFDTVYDKKALTAMARALRKTLRKKHSRRSHIFGFLIAALALFLSLRDLPSFSLRNGVTLLAAPVLLFVLLFEDTLNGYVARKRMLVGTERAKSRFSEESYVSATAVGETVFYYENIAALAEDKNYFIFLFSFSHAQVYDKHSLAGGAEAAFRSFIEQRCGKKFTFIG